MYIDKEKKKDLQENKKILIYLYHQFNGDNGKIITELMERKVKSDRETVNKFIKDNNIKLSDYKCMWESKFPKRYQEELSPVMIIHIKDIKSVKPILDKHIDKLNMTVRELIKEMDLSTNISLSELNEILKENNIPPFN